MAVNVEELYRRYGPMVLRRCRAMLKHEQLAVEAMQDVFVKVLVHQERLEDRGCSSLLYRMATNHCLNQLRGQSRRPEDSQSELLQRIASTTREEEQSEARNLWDKLVQKESVSTATMAVYHLHDGMTLQEVADAVGMSVSGVRKRLRKLKSSLQELNESGELT